MNAISDLSADIGSLSLSSRDLAKLMDAVVRRGVPFRFRATGKSMSPIIRDHDVVTISPRAMGEPRVGQVAACRLPKDGRLVVHRVVRRRRGQVLIKGDRVCRCDGWMPLDCLLGVVCAVERGGRSLFWPWKGVGARFARLALVELFGRRVLRAVRRRVKRVVA